METTCSSIFFREHILAGPLFSHSSLSQLPIPSCTKFALWHNSCVSFFIPELSLLLWGISSISFLWWKLGNSSDLCKFSQLHLLHQRNNISFPDIFFPLSTLSSFLVEIHSLFQNSTFPQSLPQGRLYLSCSLWLSKREGNEPGPCPDQCSVFLVIPRIQCF